MRALIAILTAFMLFAATPVLAGDFEDGLTAYRAGDYRKALGLWEQVDQLSSNKLKKLADSGALTVEQREAVNKYLERSESSRVGLRKRKT